MYFFMLHHDFTYKLMFHLQSTTYLEFRVLIYPTFPGGSDGKESTCNAGDLGSVPGLGRSPGEGNGYSLQYSCLENPHGQRILV